MKITAISTAALAAMSTAVAAKESNGMYYTNKRHEKILTLIRGKNWII